jgi:predicted aspartyl protease
MNLKGVAAALGLLAAGMAGPASAACALNQVGQMKIEMVGGAPTIAGSVNGKPFRLLLATGSNISSLKTSAVERLGLKTQTVDNAIARSGDQEIKPVITFLPNFNVGGLQGKDARFLVGPDSAGELDGALGNEFFNEFDVEYDFAGGAIRLFRPKDCGDAWLAYWGENATFASLYVDQTAVTEVVINGHKMRAELSPSTSISLLSMEAARRAGIATEGAGVQPAEPVYNGRVPTWFVPVETFAIGDEVIQRTRLRVGDVNANPIRTSRLGSSISRDVFGETVMVLGTDFFRSHRILVSASQRRLWITYLGGGVFQRAPAQAAGR